MKAIIENLDGSIFRQYDKIKKVISGEFDDLSSYYEISNDGGEGFEVSFPDRKDLNDIWIRVNGSRVEVELSEECWYSIERHDSSIKYLWIALLQKPVEVKKETFVEMMLEPIDPAKRQD